MSTPETGSLSSETKLSIDDLEKILQRDDEQLIEILPNGEIRAIQGDSTPKVLTMRDNLGGEYAVAS